MYIAFWRRVNDILDASFFGKLFLSIVRAIGGAFRESWFFGFFTQKNMADVAENSFFVPLIRKIIFNSRFTDFVSQSFLIKMVCDVPKWIMSSRLLVYSFYLLPSCTLLFLRNFGNLAYMVLFASLFVVALLILRCKITVGKLLENSAFFGGLCRFFDIKTDYKPIEKPYIIYAFSSFLGLLVGGVSFVSGDTIMLAAFVGCIALPVLLDSPLLLLSATFLSGILLSTLPAFALSLITFLIILCRVFGGKEQLPRMRAMYIITLLYSLLIVYHIVFGFGGGDGMVAGSIQLILMLCFFSVVVVINSKDRILKLCQVISTSSVLTSLIGIYQYLGGNAGTGWVDKDISQDLGRIVSTFANPNVYGEFLTMTICVTVVSLFCTKGVFKKIFFLGCLGLQFVNLALTYSRGCYIAVMLAALIIVWFVDKRILGFGIFAIPAIPYVIPQNILARISSVGSYLKDSSVSYRFSIWTGCLRIIQNHWYVGSGVGTVAFLKFYQDYMLTGVTAQHSHNLFMQVTIEMSILAPIILVLILLFAVKDVSFTMKNNNCAQPIMIIPFVAAIVGMLFEGMVDYIFYNNIIFMMFWMIVGMIVASLNVFDKEKANEKL